jgi:hypothetical protein
MKHGFATWFVLLGSLAALGACGPLDGAEEGDVVAGDDMVAESVEALSDPVPGLNVGASDAVSGPDLRQRYTAYCDTTWKDSTHAVQSLCQIQRYWSSAWHADAVGWTELNQVSNDVLSQATRWCVGGEAYTLRVIARGRVLWSTGWSPTKQAIGRTTRLICPE